MAADFHRLWICCVLAAVANAAPQSKPASGPGLPDAHAAEDEVRSRVRALESEINATKTAVAAGSLTSAAAASRLRAAFDANARPLAEVSVAFSRECAIAAIRAEEALTAALADTTKKLAAAEDDLRARAEKLAASLWKLVPADSAPADASVLARGLQAARDDWQTTASRAMASIAEIQTLREDAIAKHTQTKRLAFRVSQDVKNQFARAMQQLLAAEPLLADDIAALLADSETRGEQLLERARLAQDRALKTLETASSDREAALAQAQQKFERELQSFESARAGGSGEWDRNLRRFSTEAARTLRDLAERNRAGFESRAAAIRTLWQHSEPVERARGLEPAARDEMLRVRQSEHEELRRTAAELARLREMLGALRSRAAMD